MSAPLISEYSIYQILDYSYIAQLAFSSCYLLSCLFLLSNRYAGFVALLSGLVYFGYTLLSYYLIRRKISRTFYGAILAANLFSAAISLENAIFFGQYSNCSPYIENLSSRNKNISQRLYGVECNHTGAMESLCTFAVFLMLSYIFQSVMLLRYKDEILGSAPLDEGYAAVPVVIPSNFNSKTYSIPSAVTDV